MVLAFFHGKTKKITVHFLHVFSLRLDVKYTTF